MIRASISADMTLPEFYDAYVYPICRIAKDVDPKTIALDRAALKHWLELTDNPPLKAIDEFITADFVNRVKDLPGRHGRPMSPNTVIKHCVHLQFVLDRAGPWSRKLGNTAKLIKEPPAFQKPKARKVARPALLSLEEIGAWMRAAEDADTPTIKDVYPARWWRVLITFLYNTGLRIDCAMRLEWPMLDDDGWLTVPAEIYKGHERGGQFYVNTATRAALETVRPWGHDRLFPWANWPVSSSWLQSQRRHLWRKAGINQPGNGFHGLRRTLLTWIAGQNDLVARVVAGHSAGSDVLQGHYIDKFKVVPQMLEQVPQPTFRHDHDADQQTLFEV